MLLNQKELVTSFNGNVPNYGFQHIAFYPRGHAASTTTAIAVLLSRIRKIMSL